MRSAIDKATKCTRNRKCVLHSIVIPSLLSQANKGPIFGSGPGNGHGSDVARSRRPLL